MSWIWGILGFAILAVIWAAFGAFNAQGRLRAKEEELDDWSGVYDVKREVDNRLTDKSHRDRLRKKYNDNA